MFLIEDGVKVEFENIGEGMCGDYNDADPDDVPLLRFYVSLELPDGDWEDVDDASYCTQVDVRSSEQVIEDHLETIMMRVKDKVLAGSSIKKICEELSWIGDADYESYWRQ